MLTTSCKHCVFKIKEGEQQTGCQLNRFDTAKTFDDEGDGVVLGFCNGFRPQRWVEDVEAKDMQEMLSIVRHEMVEPINFVIQFKDSLEDLKKTLASIAKIENLNKRSTLTVVNRKVEFNEEISKIIFSQNLHEDRMFLMYIVDENNPVMNSCFKNFNIGQMVTVWAGYEFSADFSQKLCNFINVDLQKLYLVYDDTKYLCHTSMFKVLNGDLPMINGESGTLIEKILRRDKGTGIYEWSKFFA